MTTLVFLKEHLATETRCGLLPENIKAYTNLGAKVLVESGIAEHIKIPDNLYQDAGADVVSDRLALIKQADVILTLHKLSIDELAQAKKDVMTVSFLDPFNNQDYVKQMLELGVTSLSMEMIPRSSRCQKMDALSSQASLAGYTMVIDAAKELQAVLPMMMTPAGTLKPAKVFVIGAGVAGLQAIATAKRLGASVMAYDTREVVAEQVESLGAKFLQIDIGETGQTEQGYAKALTPEQMEKQRHAQEKCIVDSDIVITTAQLFGRKPPRLINKETISKMKMGSVLVDMAAESGGNIEGSVAGETVEVNSVKIIGTGNWSGAVARHASQMYASNLFNLLAEFWDKESSELVVNIEDDILQSSLITHQGQLINQTIASLITGDKE